jgi:hypothetical protein
LQFDKTQIAIRQRSLTENLDLSFSVLRDYWAPILGWSIAGILPFAMINYFVLARQLDYEGILVENAYDISIGALRFRYGWNAMLLIALQSPLALIPVTYYLGQSVFTEKPSRGKVVEALRTRFWTIMFVLGGLRFGLLGWVAMLWVDTNSAYSPFAELFLGVLVCFGIAVLCRAFRPFAPEILVLERCPLKSKPTAASANQITFGRRSKWLHSALAGELFSHLCVIGVIAVLGSSALLLCWMFLKGLLFGNWQWGWLSDAIFIPLSGWTMAVFCTIYRFLSYIDARVRLEGWEVELRFRAEAERLEASA